MRNFEFVALLLEKLSAKNHESGEGGGDTTQAFQR